MNVRAVLLLTLLLHAPAAAQEFKRPERMPRERYVFGLPIVKVKPGSRFAELRFPPQGWEFYVVEVNRRRITLVSDFDGPEPEYAQKAAACTEVHQALSGKGPIQLTFILKRPGNARGLLFEMYFPEWDAGLVYNVKKWTYDLSKITFPHATTEVGTEGYQLRHSYTQLERRVEIADFERLRRDKEEKKKNPALGLKSLESFKAVQRKLRIDEGSATNGNEERDYQAARREIAGGLDSRASGYKDQKEWFEYFRAMMSATGLEGGMDPAARKASFQATSKLDLATLDPQSKNRLLAEAAAEIGAAFKEKRHLDAGVAATLCHVLGDPNAAKVVEQAKKAAFSVAEIPKADLDGWMGLLGGLPPLPVATDLKEGEIYRAEGKVEKSGPFTLVKGAAQSWVFEDKIGLKFDDGDTFLAVAVFEGKKPPEKMPEELKSHPFLRLVVVR